MWKRLLQTSDNVSDLVVRLALLAIAAEFLGSIGLFVGFLSRVAAFGIFCNMAAGGGAALH